MEDLDFCPYSSEDTEREWCAGPFGYTEDPPERVTKWKQRKLRDGKPTKPIHYDWEVEPARRILQSLKSYTLDWVKDAVKKRHKSDKMDTAQSIFALDPFNTVKGRASNLRNLRQDDESDYSGATNRQINRIQTWIDSTEATHSGITEKTRPLLILHCSLTTSEQAVLQELHRAYDQALCHFLWHTVSTTMARYVNAQRLKAVSAGQTFGWKEHEEAVLSQCRNTSKPNDLLNYFEAVREEFLPVNLWVAERQSKRRLLEDDGVQLPEETWLSYSLHLVTSEERQILDVPADNLLSTFSLNDLAVRTARADPRGFKPFKHNFVTSALGRRVLEIHRAVKAYREKKKNEKPTQSGKPDTRQNGSDTKDHDGPPDPAKLRALEKKSALPQKDGKPDAEKFALYKDGSCRQAIWKRMEKGLCVRCGESEPTVNGKVHHRGNCPKPAQSWEKDFDKGASFWGKPKKANSKQTQRVQRDGGEILTASLESQGQQLTVGIDSCSSVDTCREDKLFQVTDVEPFTLNGTGGSLRISQMGYLPTPSENGVIMLPMYAVPVEEFGGDVTAIFGLPKIRASKLSLDSVIQMTSPSLAATSKDGKVLLTARESAPRQTNSHSRFILALLAVLTLFSTFTAAFNAAPSEALLPGTPGGRLPPLDVCDVALVNDELFAPVASTLEPLSPLSDEHHSDPPTVHHQLMQKSSFTCGKALQAVASIVDARGSRQNYTVGLDTHSDVTAATRDVLTGVHQISDEQVGGVGGSVHFKEEGTLTVVTPDGKLVPIPALVASAKNLPRGCKALLGLSEINTLDVKLDEHRKKQRQPLQCYLGEKKLRQWWEANQGQSIETKPFDPTAVDVDPDFSLQQRVRAAIQQREKVFEGSKGSLPKPFKAAPVELNFKPDFKPTAVPEPKWSYGYGKVVSQWAADGLSSGLLEPSTSEWASRPHVVVKPPPGVHPSVARIEDCKLRVCGDYRSVNTQIAKLVPNLPVGTDEMEKGAGYRYYFEADAHSCYNSFALAKGLSREALAVWTPLGLVQPRVLPFGQKNSGTEAQGPYRAAISELSPDTRSHLSNYMDDFMGFARTPEELCVRWEEFLAVCEKHHITLNPHKTKIGYAKATFFGFEVDEHGSRLAEKHLDPIENMVPPRDLPELRRVLGIFVQSRKYIKDYAKIVKPLTRLTGKQKWEWGPPQQKAFDTVRDRLLSGVHLSPPDYSLPFHLFTDASDDGKGAVLCQFPGIPSQYPHSKHHNADNMRVISYFSKCWADNERNRPPFYLEANALLWGMDKAKIYALSSPFPLYTYSDHQPLKWIEKSDKGPVSNFILEHLSELEYVHQYLQGHKNDMADATSRYPMLGPRQLAPKGIHHSFTELLSRLPVHLRDSKSVQVHAGRDTEDIARVVQRWKHSSSPIVQKPFPRTNPRSFAPDLALFFPKPDLSPAILAQLLASSVPFGLLMPADLVTQVKTKEVVTTVGNDVDTGTLSAQLQQTGKIMMLESNMIWIIGNIPELADFAETFSAQLCTPAPLLCYSTVLDNGSSLPSTLEDWAQTQSSDPHFSDDLPDESLVAVRDGLSVYLHDDSPARIIVPPSLREQLVRETHVRMHHLGATKVHHCLRQSYFWPAMRRDCRNILSDCPECELQKARRNEAHALFSAQPLAAPRSRWSMDFQGMGKALTGESEVLAIIDSASRFVVVIPLYERSANSFVPALADNLIFKHGAPDILHTDDAPEFMSEALHLLSESTGITRTSTLGHHAQGNAQIEVFWRYWNRCMRLLPDSHYQQWPRFAQRVAFAYNTAAHSSLGDVSPFEIFHGIPARNPFTTPAIDTPLDTPLPEVDLDDVKAFARAVKVSAAAFTSLAKGHDEYVRETTAARLNEHGNPTSFEVGDNVKIYVPPSHAQMVASGRPAKHIVAWRGPCEVIDKLSPTAYTVRELSTGRTFQRTLINMKPYRASTAAPPPTHDPFYDDPFVPGELLFVRDDPHSNFHLAKVLEIVNESMLVHYYGCKLHNMSTATFRPCWIHADTDTITMQNTRPRNQSAYTGRLDLDAMDSLLVARKLELTGADRLTKRSRVRVHSVRDELFVYA